MWRLARRIIRADQLGALSHCLNPSRGRAWGGPMNGQALRCLLVAEIIIHIKPAAIVETGTYLGTTTEWLSAFQIPVYTCEASAENFGFSSSRLRFLSNVQIINSDSRDALKSLKYGPLASEGPILFYLDAHWNEDLPLDNELGIIFSSWQQAVVLIDDFQVHDDPGYGFDDYGPGKRLTLDYVADKILSFGLAAYYPRSASNEETGEKRGCIVLAKSDTMGQILSSVSLIRKLT
jgi:hypothetical protein